MAYSRVNWQDLPSTATPRNAENLNIMDAGIYNLDANKADKTEIPTKSHQVNVGTTIDSDYKVNFIHNANEWDYTGEPIISFSVTKSNITNGIRITCDGSGTNVGSYMEIPYQPFAGKTVNFKVDINPSSTNTGKVLIVLLNSSDVITTTLKTINESGSYDIAIPSILPSGSVKLAGLFYGNVNGTASSGNYVDYVNIMWVSGNNSIYVDGEEILPKYNGAIYANDFKCRNLFNKNSAIYRQVNVNSTTVLNTGIRITCSNVSTGVYSSYYMGKYKDFYGKTITAKSTIQPNSSRGFGLMIWSYNGGSSGTMQSLDEKTGTGTSATLTSSYTFNNSAYNTYDVVIVLYAKYGSGSVTTSDYTDFTDLQVEIGEATSYTPYKEFEVKQLNGKGTFTHSSISMGNAYYHKINNLVIVNIVDLEVSTAISSAGSVTKIGEGLPKNSGSEFGTIENQNNGSTAYTIRTRVYSDGEIEIYYGNIPTSQIFYGTFT